jgi:hypothetical protein
LAKDKNNIQILKAFTLQNALSGLSLLLLKLFGCEYVITTIIVDEETGDVID